MAEFKYEIKEELGILSEGKNSVKKVCYISYNDRDPKLDIRDWFEEGEKMGKGITLSKEESLILKEILNNLDI